MSSSSRARSTRHASAPRRFAIVFLGLILGLPVIGWSQSNQGPKPTGGYAQANPGATGGATLYSYGAAVGDTALPRNDDGFVNVSFSGVGPAGSSLALPFYASSYNNLYVNNNGLVSFKSGVSQFTPDHFPVPATTSSAPKIAPFWADVDTRPANGGYVWHRTAQDAATLTAIKNQIFSSFLGVGNSFTPTFAEIVTWDQVGYFNEKTNYVNTFQAVIASDGVQTYTFFLYPKNAIWWVSGEFSNGAPAQVGFDAGDGVNFHNATGTYSSQMYDLELLTNTTVPSAGVQAFKIDQGPIRADQENGQLVYPAKVVAGDLALAADTNTATYQLQLSNIAVGSAQTHTISSTAASGSLQFNQLTFDDPTETLVFSGAGVMLANRIGAITHGNLHFTGTSALVARVAGSVDGGTLTFQANSKLHVWAANALTANANLVFDNGSVGASGTGGTVDLRGLSTSVGTLNSVGTAAGLITSSLAGASTLTVGNSGTGNFSGVIENGAGTVSLVKTGSGTQTLSGANTYTGGTTISAGTLQLGDGGTTGSVVGNITNNGTLAFNRSDALIYANVISGTGALTKLGANTLTLTGTNTFTGTTTVSAGTLQIGNAGTTGAIAGNLVNNAAVTFNRSDAVIFAGNISGTGSLTKLGSATLTVTGANTSTGGTTISEGTLQIGAGSTTGSLTGNVTNNAILVFNRSDASSHGGVITGTGTLTKSGAGVLTLNGANTYTGATTISTGTLALTSTTSSSAFAIASGAVLELNAASGHNEMTGATTFTGTGTLRKTGANNAVWSGTSATFALGAGSLIDVQGGTLVGGSSANEVWTANLSSLNVEAGATFWGAEANVRVNALSGAGNIRSGLNGAGYATFTFGVNNGSGTFAGVIANTDTAGGHLGHFTKVGTGTQILTGANTYTGGTTISAGTLQIGNGGTSGSLAGNVINNATLTFNRSDASGYSGGISGSGAVTKSGAGKLTLTGANIYTGGTTVSGGTLQIGNDGTTGSLSGNVAAASGSTLAFARSDAISFGGIVSGAGALTKLSAGVLTLTGANTHTGGTTISAGTLQIGNGATTGSIAGNITNNSALIFNRSDALTYSGTISGTGTLTKTGAGTLTLSGAQSFNGGTTIDAGVLALAGAGAPSNRLYNTTINSGGTLRLLDHNVIGTSTITVNGGTLDFNGKTDYFASLVLSNGGTVGGAGSFTLESAGNSMLSATGGGNAGTISTAFGITSQFGVGGNSARTLEVNTAASTTLTISGVIRNTLEGTARVGSLTKTGTGTLTLSGANTYTGATTINGGKLVVDGSLAAASAVDINSGGSLGGSGSVGAVTVNSGGTIAPGNSPGTLTTGSETWNGGANYVWEINNAANPATTAGTNYDLLAISGTLTINATAGNKFTLTLASLLQNNSAGNVVNFNSATNSSYTIASATGGIIGFDANAFTINSTGFTNTLNGGSWNLSQSGNNLNLNFAAAASAIPEPSTYAAIFGALALGLTIYRKRQLRKN